MGSARPASSACEPTVSASSPWTAPTAPTTSSTSRTPQQVERGGRRGRAGRRPRQQRRGRRPEPAALGGRRTTTGDAPSRSMSTARSTCCRAVLPGMVERGWGRDRQPRQHRRQGRQPEPDRLLGVQGGGHRDDQVAGEGAGHLGRHRQLVAPAVFETPMNADTAPEVLDRLISLIPMGRLGRPEELAALVSWLVLGRVQLLLRRRLRHQRRPGDLLTSSLRPAAVRCGSHLPGVSPGSGPKRHAGRRRGSRRSPERRRRP